MTTASDWLKSPNRNYADGVQLLKQLDSKDRQLEFLSVANPTDYQVQLLRERIARCVRLGKQARVETKAEVTGADKTVQIVKKNQQATEQQQRVTIDKNPIVRLEELPSEMQIKYQAAMTAGRKLSSLKEALKVAKNDAERADIGQQLDTIEGEKNKLWGEVDAWWNANKTGAATNVKPATKSKPAPTPKPKPVAKKKNKPTKKGK